MSDELPGVGLAIKSLYPKDYGEIFQFAQSVVSHRFNVEVIVEDNEFSQFAGKLNCVRKESAHDTKVSWGGADLSLGTSQDDKLAAQTRYKMGGGFAGCDREFRVIEIGQHRLVFLRWDMQATMLFWNGKQVAAINKRAGFGVNLLGGRVEVLSPDGGLLFTVRFPPVWLMFARRRVCCGENEVLIPGSWPNPGGLPKESISKFARVSFSNQIIIIAVLLWADNSK